jgi:acylglycerol lipase
MKDSNWITVCSLAVPIAAYLALRTLSDPEKDKIITMTTTTVFGEERTIDIPSADFPTAKEIEELEGYMPPCEHGWYESVTDQAKLHYRYWIPQPRPQAVLIYQHGIQTHGGKALPNKNCALLAKSCLEAGIAVFAPDLYGHGYSEGTRFLIPGSYESNLNDLLALVALAQERHPSLPIFLMGESYGGTLVLHASHQLRDNANFKGFLLSGPAIIGDLPPYPVYCLLRYVLAPKYPAWCPFFMPNPVSPERIWKDPQVLEYRTSKRYREMGLDGSGKPFRLGTALQLVLAMEDVRENVIPNVKHPFCIVHGTDDAGVPISGSEFLWEHAQTEASDKAFLRSKGAFHDLLSDPAAEEHMEYYINWMKKQLE